MAAHRDMDSEAAALGAQASDPFLIHGGRQLKVQKKSCGRPGWQAGRGIFSLLKFAGELRQWL